MELYFKGAAGILLAAVLGLALQKQEKDLSAVLTAAVIAMAAVLMLRLLEPVLELLRQLEQVGNLRSDALELLLKAAGIGLTAEVAGLVCADAGNAALAKMLRLLGTAAILCLSVPMFTALLECITEMGMQDKHNSAMIVKYFIIIKLFNVPSIIF